MKLAELIEKRRTYKRFDGTDISEEQVKDWLRTSLFAPNHRRNEPWRFLFFSQSDLRVFNEKACALVPQILQHLGPEKIQAKQEGMTKLMAGAGAAVFVFSARDEKPLIDLENYAAVSCLIQNLMLLVTEAGLDSFWSTNQVLISPQAAPLIGYNPEKYQLAGAIYLGKGTTEPVPRKYTFDDKFSHWSSDSSDSLL